MHTQWQAIHREAERKDRLAEAEGTINDLLDLEKVKETALKSMTDTPLYADLMLFKVNISEFIYLKKREKKLKKIFLNHLLQLHHFIFMVIYLTEKQGAVCLQAVISMMREKKDDAKDWFDAYEKNYLDPSDTVHTKIRKLKKQLPELKKKEIGK